MQGENTVHTHENLVSPQYRPRSNRDVVFAAGAGASWRNAHDSEAATLPAMEKQAAKK